MFEQTFKNIDDILHKDAGCTSELDYTEQSSWLLFLKYLDALEHDKQAEAELEGKRHAFILAESFRWEAWAAPKTPDGKPDHNAAMIFARRPPWSASWMSCLPKFSGLRSCASASSPPLTN